MTKRDTLHYIFQQEIKLKEKLLMAMEHNCPEETTAEVMKEYFCLEFRTKSSALAFVQSFFENPIY